MSDPTQPQSTDEAVTDAPGEIEAPRYNHILRDEEGNCATFNHDWLFTGVYGKGGKLITRDALYSTIPIVSDGP